jgi:two-component sensor histidine kinase
LQNDILLTRLNKAATLIRLKRLDDAHLELSYFSNHRINKTQTALNTRFFTVQGNYWLQKGDKKQAMWYYDTAIAIATARELPELYAVVYRNMGEAYYAIQEYQSAYDYAQKYSSKVRELGLGVKTLNLESVKEYLDLKSSKDEIAVLNNEKQLKELQLLNEATLRQSLEKENRFKDSLLLRGAELQASHDREYQLQQTKLKNEQHLRLSLLAGLSSALLLGSLAFFLYRKQRKKNIIIAKQAEELETLMKEIHHRVKNNLQVISSLLDLQSMTIKDTKAASAIKESKNRVQSMALIHQNLYNVGNIKGINMQDYIQNLARSLFDSYNIQPDKISLKTDIDPLSLDVDTVIHIGLTLNELISNALKYAFNEQESGEITVIFKMEDNNLLLKVRDNGKGFKNSYDNQGNSFGFKIIRAFAQKLKAKLDVFNNDGACVEMRITNYKLA